jgi:hypothetical protein
MGRNPGLNSFTMKCGAREQVRTADVWLISVLNGASVVSGVGASLLHTPPTKIGYATNNTERMDPEERMVNKVMEVLPCIVHPD